MGARARGCVREANAEGLVFRGCGRSGAARDAVHGTQSIVDGLSRRLLVAVGYKDIFEEFKV